MNAGGPSPFGSPGRKRRGHFILENASAIWYAAGPRITMKMAGKMHSSVGNRIFTAAFCAFSSAFCCRSSRQLSECSRSALTLPAPYALGL